jgi:hypothetical protein
MAQQPYNPCDDGFPAKVWECLRRNREFQRYVEQDAKFPQVHSHISLLANFLLRTRGRIRPPFPTWKELSVDERSRFQSYETHEFAPQKIDISRASEVLQRSLSPLVKKNAGGHSQGSRSQSINEAVDEIFVPGLFITVCLPRHILSSEHRKRVLKAIDGIVPQSSTHGTWVKCNGKVLGTRKAWEHFLHYELLVERGCPKEMRLNFAGHLSARHRPSKIQALLGAKHRTTKDWLALNSSISKHRNPQHAREYIDGINGCIESVFPKFAPSHGGRSRTPS